MQFPRELGPRLKTLPSPSPHTFPRHPAQQGLQVHSRVLIWTLPALGQGNQEEFLKWLSEYPSDPKPQTWPLFSLQPHPSNASPGPSVLFLAIKTVMAPTCLPLTLCQALC